MKRFFLALFLLALSVSIFAQYPEVTIRDIQYINPDSLNVYFVDDVPGPYEGDTVTVTGMFFLLFFGRSNP